MTLPVTPRDGNYIIEKDKRPTERQAGSIILVETDERLISSGIIRGAPTGATFEPGQRVYFSPFTGYSLIINDAEYVQLLDHDILGTFNEGAEVYVA